MLINKYAVQPVHSALFRILSFRPVSLLAISGNQLELSGFSINHTYGMALRISQINISFGPNRYPLGS